MSSLPETPTSVRHFKSPFNKVIATHYYDGPMEGFLAHSDWPQACVFQLIDWDRETDVRVYEVARVEDLLFEDVVGLLFQERLPTWPVWVLPSNERAKELVDDCMARARPVATITTRDLFGQIGLWTPADDAPASSGLIAVASPRRHDSSPP
jgi:hypothetical protein